MFQRTFAHGLTLFAVIVCCFAMANPATAQSVQDCVQVDWKKKRGSFKYYDSVKNTNAYMLEFRNRCSFTVSVWYCVKERVFDRPGDRPGPICGDGIDRGGGYFRYNQAIGPRGSEMHWGGHIADGTTTVIWAVCKGSATVLESADGNRYTCGHNFGME